MSAAVSPLAPKHLPDMPAIAGMRLATAAAGIRYKGRTDVLMAILDKGTTVAGVFTRSKCPSAPVEWCRAKLDGGRARALVVNSGNANAFTGKGGREATKLTAGLAAKAVGCRANEVFLASTGVIGEPLPASKFAAVMDRLVAGADPTAWLDAAKAIMTTDTYPKVATATARLGPATVTFNAVTVDGDTSTSDTLMAFATGAAASRGAPRIARANDTRLAGLRTALDSVLANLSEQIA